MADVDRHLRGPLPRWAARFVVPGLFLLFGNGLAAAAIYGKAFRPRSPGEAWLETLIGEVGALLLVSLIPKSVFFVRVRRRLLNVAFAVALVGGYIVASLAGALVGIGFIFAGVAGVVYWTGDPRTVRQVAATLGREGRVQK